MARGTGFAVDLAPLVPYLPSTLHSPRRRSGASMLPRTLPPLAIAVCLMAAGCRFIGGQPAVTAAANVTRADSKPTRQSIELELLFIRCDEHDTAVRDELWNFVDEQFLDRDLRARLAANGLRVGIVGDHLPPHLAARFTPTASEPAAGHELATDSAVARRLLRLLPGRRSEIVTASGIRELVLLERSGGGVSGATYHDASPLIAIEVRPAADGRVRITAVPEIRHGPLRKSWVGEDGMFRLETGQRRHHMEHLQFTAVLPRDGMLLVGSVGDESASVGDCLLRDHDRGERTSVRLVAIRPLADTVDPLFTADDGTTQRGSDEAPLTIR